MDNDGNIGSKKSPMWTTVLLGFWIILLVPWIVITPLSAMGFDAGYTVDAYTLFWSLLTYPITVLMGGLLRRKRAILILLPCTNFLALWLVPAIAHHR